MVKRYRCGGITKKGERCKNRSVNGLGCRFHKQKEKTALETYTKSLQVTTGTVAVIKIIYEVVKFLIAHWPEINRFFHGLDTNSYINYWHGLKDDSHRAMTSSKVTELEAHDLVVEFNSWFPTLPRDVQEMVFNQFGRREIERIRRKGASEY